MSGAFGLGSNSGGPRNSESMFGSTDKNVGGEHGYARSPMQRFRDDTKATDSKRADFRNDIQYPLTVLEARFPEEFKKADEHIKQRQESWYDKYRLNLAYDFENDRGFESWQAEKQARKDFLHIHDIDDWMDDYILQIQYGLRIFTTIGFLHGVWRTGNLWRSIDRNYAKLHGVGLQTLAAEHISMSVLKGTAVGVACAVGTLSGQAGARVAEAYWRGDLLPTRRKWQHVTASCVSGGLWSAGMAVAVNWYALKPFGHAMMAGTIVTSATVIGAYLGVMVYKPWQEQFPNDYNETPTPWYDKTLQNFGPAGERGKWV